IYSLAELEALSNFANANDIRLHMDGARFANALVALGCSPAEMTWKRGIDVLSLGATKNGTFCAEAILFFDQELAQGFVRHLKRSGHLLSKQRFMSEQLLALLNNGLWLETANKANQTAQTIAKAISEIPNAKVWGVTEANIVLASLPIAIAMTLEKQGVWFRCGPMSPLGMCECRFVTSFETTETEVAALSAVVASLGSIIAKGDKS
ncbi:MAG: beta-eliminating lyase-related protein, partial [Sedimenticola sp.]